MPAKIGQRHTQSPETRGKISAALLKKWADPAYRAKISRSVSRSMSASPKFKASVEARRGSPLSPETRAKISEGLRGRWEDPIYRAKVNRSLTGHVKHGHAKHYEHTPTYRSWDAMLARCTNPRNTAWRHYGGRGIQVCDRWRVFVNFLADMGERPPGTSIDRKDNDLGYFPGNCRWGQVELPRFGAASVTVWPS